MKKEFVYIKAEVLRRDGKVIDVQLRDGFGKMKTVVHKKNAIRVK